VSRVVCTRLLKLLLDYGVWWYEYARFFFAGAANYDRELSRLIAQI
jgi:hypothetical protein